MALRGCRARTPDSHEITLSPYTVGTSGMARPQLLSRLKAALLSFVGSEKFARLAPGLAEAWRSLRHRDEAAWILF